MQFLGRGAAMKNRKGVQTQCGIKIWELLNQQPEAAV
jgi:hypothetical protein